MPVEKIDVSMVGDVTPTITDLVSTELLATETAASELVTTESGIKASNKKADKKDKSEIKTITQIYDDMVREDYDIRYNTLKHQIEARLEFSNDWEVYDDEARATLRAIYQSKGVRDKSNVDEAVTLYAKRLHKVNPLLDYVRSIELPEKYLDKQLCKNFLRRVIGATLPNEQYVDEVSRLIFAGGINRLTSPGCKFDYVPVFIGKQGNGKSTIVRWLATADKYFFEVRTIEGKDSMEELRGKWICEVAELSALKRAKDVERAKAFFSSTKDTYREAYGHSVTDYDRSCIFIGTTNEDAFLTDMTGNRRYLPIEIPFCIDRLTKNESQIKKLIELCWAEAYALRDTAYMLPYFNSDLWVYAEQEQARAAFDDPRVGLIEKYIASKKPGDFVCVKEIWDSVQGIKRSKQTETPEKSESLEIGRILSQMPCLRRPTPDRQTCGKYGQQRAWQKVKIAE